MTLLHRQNQHKTALNSVIFWDGKEFIRQNPAFFRESKIFETIHKLRGMVSTSNCLRWKCAAAVVNATGFSISYGYNHAFLCSDSCYREDNNIESGTRYESCSSIHAEQMALIAAPSTVGRDLILLTVNQACGQGESLRPPCSICAKMLLYARINRIYQANPYKPDEMIVFDCAELCKTVISGSLSVAGFDYYFNGE